MQNVCKLFVNPDFESVSFDVNENVHAIGINVNSEFMYLVYVKDDYKNPYYIKYIDDNARETEFCSYENGHLVCKTGSWILLFKKKSLDLDVIEEHFKEYLNDLEQLQEENPVKLFENFNSLNEEYSSTFDNIISKRNNISSVLDLNDFSENILHNTEGTAVYSTMAITQILKKYKVISEENSNIFVLDFLNTKTPEDNFIKKGFQKIIEDFPSIKIANFVDLYIVCSDTNKFAYRIFSEGVVTSVYLPYNDEHIFEWENIGYYFSEYFDLHSQKNLNENFNLNETEYEFSTAFGNQIAKINENPNDFIDFSEFDDLSLKKIPVTDFEENLKNAIQKHLVGSNKNVEISQIYFLTADKFRGFFKNLLKSCEKTFVFSLYDTSFYLVEENGCKFIIECQDADPLGIWFYDKTDEFIFHWPNIKKNMNKFLNSIIQIYSYEPYTKFMALSDSADYPEAIQNMLLKYNIIKSKGDYFLNIGFTKSQDYLEKVFLNIIKDANATEVGKIEFVYDETLYLVTKEDNRFIAGANSDLSKIYNLYLPDIGRMNFEWPNVCDYFKEINESVNFNLNEDYSYSLSSKIAAKNKDSYILFDVNDFGDFCQILKADDELNTLDKRLQLEYFNKDQNIAEVFTSFYPASEELKEFFKIINYIINHNPECIEYIEYVSFAMLSFFEKDGFKIICDLREKEHSFDSVANTVMIPIDEYGKIKIPAHLYKENFNINEAEYSGSLAHLNSTKLSKIDEIDISKLDRSRNRLNRNISDLHQIMFDALNKIPGRTRLEYIFVRASVENTTFFIHDKVNTETFLKGIEKIIKHSNKELISNNEFGLVYKITKDDCVFVAEYKESSLYAIYFEEDPENPDKFIWPDARKYFKEYFDYLKTLNNINESDNFNLNEADYSEGLAKQFSLTEFGNEIEFSIKNLMNSNSGYADTSSTLFSKKLVECLLNKKQTDSNKIKYLFHRWHGRDLNNLKTKAFENCFDKIIKVAKKEKVYDELEDAGLITSTGKNTIIYKCSIGQYSFALIDDYINFDNSGSGKGIYIPFIPADESNSKIIFNWPNAQYYFKDFLNLQESANFNLNEADYSEGMLNPIALKSGGTDFVYLPKNDRFSRYISGLSIQNAADFTGDFADLLKKYNIAETTENFVYFRIYNTEGLFAPGLHKKLIRFYNDYKQFFIKCGPGTFIFKYKDSKFLFALGNNDSIFLFAPYYGIEGIKFPEAGKYFPEYLDNNINESFNFNLNEAEYSEARGMQIAKKNSNSIDIIDLSDIPFPEESKLKLISATEIRNEDLKNALKEDNVIKSDEDSLIYVQTKSHAEIGERFNMIISNSESKYVTNNSFIVYNGSYAMGLQFVGKIYDPDLCLFIKKTNNDLCFEWPNVNLYFNGLNENFNLNESFDDYETSSAYGKQIARKNTIKPKDRDIMDQIDELLDLDKSGPGLFKYGANDLETEALLAKMHLPDYHMGFCLTSKLWTFSISKILKKGKVWAVVQFD